MTGFDILWDITATLLIHGLVFGTVVLALILLGRRCLHRMPRRAVVWLWLPLLLLAFSPLLPGIGIRMPDTPQMMTPDASVTDIPVGTVPSVVSLEVLPEDVTVYPMQTEPVIHVERSLSWRGIAGLVWLGGALVVFVYQTFRHARVRQTCWTAVKVERRGRIRICTLGGMRTPFVYGLLRPRIILPQTPAVGARERELILLHEQMHVRRLDVLWRGLWEAALCVYWFQPLLWLVEDAFIADTEGACDEAVLSSLAADRNCRADYAQTLLLYAGPKKRGYPTAFGMTEMQNRVYAILHPAGIHAASVAVLVTVLLLSSVIAFLMPISPEQEEDLLTDDVGEVSSELTTDDAGEVSGEIREDLNTVSFAVEPSSALFGFRNGYIEAHPDIWGPTAVRFALPIGWTVQFENGGGQIFDETGMQRGTCFLQAFWPIDGEDIPPENIPPDEKKWQAVYTDLRLSMMQNVADADYHPVVTSDRAQTAVAVMDRAIYEEGVNAAAWEHERVPLVLAYDQDCSMYLQMTFDDTTDTETMEAIAASVSFERTE